ncbi:RNA polymerase sigma factor [Cellulomonas cellasea]|uniref:RNA polymerase sigma factor (Sigma-70 family) n=1 Tax=Cellulomonas cellasea TaxID=43670 RepID=A0A7W4UDE8_9CELL|nr:sigma-70 family RNA polymerase sigma factor [Cellulomonas cellasea]MBB2922141.1 RNA polymerase sigma factor (sigma-70 family) [Cellulomonas cellasea]
MTDPEDLRTTRATVEAVWRIEWTRLVASLTRLTRDVGLAEDLAQDVMVVALEQWPRSGIPADPGPWLMATAKHRAVDALRRRSAYARKLAQVARTDGAPRVEDPADRPADGVEDDVLRLVFLTCHPALTRESRVALTLRLVGGLTTAEIARAFLVPETTVGQRISRAKRTLATAGVPFGLPGAAELPARLGAVLEVVYLVFNEGYAATAGAAWTRGDLCAEAQRLGRLLAALLPREPEVHGLLALLELQASRLPARTAPDGSAVLLDDQDRRRWDRLLVRRGLAALDRARALGGELGPYALQAAIAAEHARSPSPDATDWPRIAALYRVLVHVAPSPVVELNRAVAVGRARGPAAGLALVDALVAAGQLAGYPHLSAVRGELLAALGRDTEAGAEFDRAARLTRNARERELFERRARTAEGAAAPPGA